MATCDRHGLEGSCARCGEFICPACRRWAAERPYCAACHRTLTSAPSMRANVALLLATIGLCTLVPGILAIVLGRLESRAIARGEASIAGRHQADLAFALGIVEVAALLVAVIARFL